MRVFIPIEDGSVDRDVVPVPYRQGLVCVHGLREGFVLDEDGWLHFRSSGDDAKVDFADLARAEPLEPRRC